MYPKEFTTATEHNYQEMNKYGLWVCQVCGHSVKIRRDGTCIGVPIYWKWDDVPDEITTKTTLLKKHGLKLSQEQSPVGAKVQYDRKGKKTGAYYPLYSIDDATPKQPPTQAQLDALEKARYMGEKLTVTCSKCKRPLGGRYDYIKVTRKKWIELDYDNYLCRFCEDEMDAMKWATGIISQSNALILDTETTDLYGEIIEIAIIDLEGNVLLDQRIKPLGEMNPQAEDVHGISLEDLSGSPMFVDIYDNLKRILEGRNVLIYNADFDTGRLEHDCKLSELEPIKFKHECAMQWYSQYVGEWSDYHDSYRWQRLNGTHGALGDCMATLDVIKGMSFA